MHEVTELLKINKTFHVGGKRTSKMNIRLNNKLEIYKYDTESIL